MARPRRFHSEVIAELFRQISYAPAKTRKRQMDAAEALVEDVDAELNYPEEFVVYRITGYRPELNAAHDAPAMFTGAALLADLVTFVQRLSETLAMSSADFDRRPIALAALAERMSISIKTLQRYRRKGLVCHVVAQGGGGQRLVCFEDALQRFLDRHDEIVHRAAQFTRVDDSVSQRMISDARTMHQREAASLHEAAGAIAQRHGRAQETVRGIFKRHDRHAADPIFTERGPLTDREERIIDRAYRAGVSPAVLAVRFGRSRKTVYRVVNQRRAAWLRSLDIETVTMPTFAHPDAASVLLSPPIVCQDLDVPAPTRDGQRFVESTRQNASLAIDQEHALLGAFHYLRHDAIERIAALPDEPGSEVIDRIETSLRWAAMLKRRLVSFGLKVAITTIERNMHRPMIELSAEDIARLVTMAVAVVSETVDRIDPTRDQRLERMCGFSMDRRLATMQWRPPSERAAARHAIGAVLIDEPLGNVCVWQQALELPQRLVGRLSGLADRDAELIAMRYGLLGSPPLTCRQIAERVESTLTGVNRRLRAAHVRLRTMRDS